MKSFYTFSKDSKQRLKGAFNKFSPEDQEILIKMAKGFEKGINENYEERMKENAEA